MLRINRLLLDISLGRGPSRALASHGPEKEARSLLLAPLSRAIRWWTPIAKTKCAVRAENGRRISSGTRLIAQNSLSAIMDEIRGGVDAIRDPAPLKAVYPGLAMLSNSWNSPLEKRKAAKEVSRPVSSPCGEKRYLPYEFAFRLFVSSLGCLLRRVRET